jgi:SAM-dependent methyltransferase
MGMNDRATLDVYDRQADDYDRMMASEAAADPRIRDFIAACPEGGDVLDFGCGPGNYARIMAAAGLRVTALDGSAEMARRTHALPGVTAQHGYFEDLDAKAAYDGIWASFSLLHAPRADLPGHLGRLHRALRPGGVLFIGMKTGNGEGRDDLGRFYTYYSIAALEDHLRDAGFTPRQHWTGYGAGLSGQYAGWVVIEAHG